MNLYDDFKLYRDQFGLNQLYTNGSIGDTSQNGALFTMEYLICLMADPNTSDKIKQDEIIRLRQVYDTLEIYPGVSIRNPGSTEFDSMDNTGAIASFSGLYDNGSYSKRSYEHGEKTRAKGSDPGQSAEDNKKFYPLARLLSGFRAPRFFWNNNNPQLFCLPGWHGRSPGHLAVLRITAGKWISPWGAFALLVGQFWGCKEDVGNTDARKLPYVFWQFLKNRNIFWKLAYKLWCYILMKQYSEGMRSVYTIYYQDPNHPIRKHSPKFVP